MIWQILLHFPGRRSLARKSVVALPHGALSNIEFCHGGNRQCALHTINGKIDLRPQREQHESFSTRLYCLHVVYSDNVETYARVRKRYPGCK